MALKLIFACGEYDRTEALRVGAVKPEGIDLECVGMLNPRDTFDRMTNQNAFDLCEMSSSQFIAMKASGDCPYVALPVIISRIFRHGYIFLNRKSGLRAPKDLEGKRIGVGLYTQTAAIWERGLLSDEYGVDLSGITWVQGAIDKSGRHGDPKVPPLARPVKIENNTSERSLTELLAAGEIDAMTTGTTPLLFGKNPDIVRLFPDSRELEKKYFRERGLFPIMHVVAIRKEVCDANPWIAGSLYRAFEAAKEWSQERTNYTGVTRYMLPWLYDDLAEIKEVFGGDPWPYGVEPNRHNFATLVRYMVEQGLLAKEIAVDGLFAKV